MLPAERHLFIIDLKDCFFTISLHPADCEHFAFSVPTINNCEPVERCHRTVLPQGMMNSPTICQTVAATNLTSTRANSPQSVIYHYMDDILVCAQEKTYLDKTLNYVLPSLEAYGLQIAKEKIQTMPPWKYLGWVLSERNIKPQPLKISWKIGTLHELQKLLGTINWVRPTLGITNYDLQNLFVALKGDNDLNSR
ncbi:endogenous retrovirus group k member 18 pol [Limosa lapponica baueri]|uniref:ribonuclease H n=1 Tax=Limosa lapponica baueri TaxID=1758121 RepID=A0A2I0UKD0_LIMLA|nr:endogenous retrovirus group k member 18 pol [Limosa lapponica baueri]